MPIVLVLEYVGVFIQVSIRDFDTGRIQTENNLCVLLKPRVHYSAIVFDWKESEACMWEKEICCSIEKNHSVYIEFLYIVLHDPVSSISLNHARQYIENSQVSLSSIQASLYFHSKTIAE